MTERLFDCGGREPRLNIPEFCRLALRRRIALLGIVIACFLVLLDLLSPRTATAQEAPVISEIRVEGNRITEASLIRFSSGLAEGQRLVLPDDPPRVIRNLHRLNIFSDIQVYVDSDVDEGVAVVIAVKEFPKLDDVHFEGNKGIKSKKLKKKLAFVEKQWLSPHEVRRAENKIVELYKEEGFLLASVEGTQGDPNEDGQVMLTFKVNEGLKVKLRRIQFFGNQAFEGKKLRKVMKETKQVGGILRRNQFAEDTYQEDRQALLAFYQSNGFRNAEILRDSLYYDDAKANLFIDMYLDEGPLYKFGKITWEGNERVKDAGINRMIVAREGDVYSSEQKNKSQEDIQNLYSDIGHITASVAVQERLAETPHTIKVHFDIVENKPWKIRQVMISGNTKTKDRVIRRELWIRPGQTFRRSGIERSIRNIQQLNYFSNVVPELKPVEESSELDVILAVEEKSTGTASVGAGYSQYDGLLGTIALQVPNFMGNGQQLEFQLEFGERRQSFRTGFTEPWLLNTPTSLQGLIFRTTRRYYSGFDERRQGALATVGRRLVWPDFSRASVGYRIEQVKFRNFAEDFERAAQSSFRDNVTSSVNLNFTRNSRDLPIFPTSGSVFSYSPTFAGGPLGGNTDFLKHDFITSFYFPVAWRFALNLKTTIGLVRPFNDTDVPFNERYTPGGVSIFEGTMVRGYPEQSLGPRINGVPDGGNSQLLFNLEITLPVVQQQFYALAFADAGNAWDSTSETSIFDLRRSVGVGFRMIAPVVGIMGFDFAWGFDRRRVDGQKPQMVTHFQFGPQFF